MEFNTRPTKTDHAQTDSASKPEVDDFLALVDTPVIVATKKPQKASESPAILTVLTTADIRACGFKSVGEALATVPGFCDVYDELNHNLGIRCPASATFGANAFLGVVSIVTCDTTWGSSVQVYGQERSGKKGGFGLDGNLSYAQKDWGVSLAGTAAHLDRSGMRLPYASPILRILPPASLESQDDLSQLRPSMLKGLTYANVL